MTFVKLGALANKIVDDAAASRSCSVEGCTRPYYAKTFCGLHYAAARRRADAAKAEALGIKRRPLRLLITDPIPHFWSKVKKGDPTDCWPWQGAINAYGYGNHNVKKLRHLKTIMAHRIAYYLANGVMPAPDICVMHSCDNPPCCNPAHLSLGTKADNLHDMCRKRRHWTHQRPVTHCPQGHEYTPDNVYLVQNETYRICKTCARARSKARWAKQRTRRLLAGAESDALKQKEPTA